MRLLNPRPGRCAIETALSMAMGVALGIVLCLAVTKTWWTQGNAGRSPSTRAPTSGGLLRTVTAAELTNAGISLARPSSPAAVSRQRVQREARRWVHQPLEEVLANVTDRQAGLKDRLCWVVSVGPQGTFALPGGGHEWWGLAFVDAQTGKEFLFTAGGR